MEGKTEKFIDELKRVDALVFLISESDLNKELKRFLKDRNIREVYLKNDRVSFSLDLGDIKISPVFKEGIAAGITEINYGIAYSGGLVELARDAEDKLPSLLPDIHIALIREKNIVDDFEDVFERLKRPFPDITIIVGPSKTADIEKILVKGAHGPRELAVFIVR